jgi:hypothetical protein
MLSDLDLTLHDRATLPVTAADVCSLINYLGDDRDPYGWVDYVWDMRQKLPLTGRDEVVRWAFLVANEDDLDGDLIEYVDDLWNAAAGRTFELRRDSLLVDLMRDARERGWQSSPDVATMIERAVAAEEARQVARRAAEEAEFQQGYIEWLATSDEPEALAQRASIEKTAILQRLRDAGGDDLAPEQDQACARYDAEMAAWHQKYAKQGNVPMPPNLSVVPAAPLPDLIKTSAEFVAGFKPPDYLLDGIFQLAYCYSMTAQTGIGKTVVAMRLTAHVSTGRALCGRDVTKGSVIYFAGENPTDIRMRWLAVCRDMNIDAAIVDVHFIDGAMPLSQVAERITAEVVRKALRPAFVVVDTSAAYNEGDDENSNTQAGEHARRLRSLTALPGGPCVLILCHPTKRAAEDDLQPRGGGAFIAEVDGNIALQKRDSLIVANAQGKFRGSTEWSLRFELQVIRDHPLLKDTRGRQIPTIIARPVDESAATALESSGERDEDTVLRAVPARAEGGMTPTDIARKLRWFIKNDPKQPAHLKVKRTLEALKGNKLTEIARTNRWRLTAKGELELNRMDTAAKPTMPLVALPPIVTTGR